MKKSIFIGRQPIISGDKSIFGYEVLFRKTAENFADIKVSDNLSATANVLENIYDIGIKTLMGEKPAFINIIPDVLEKGMIQLLPKDKIVLEILETSRIDDNAVSIIKEFKDEGFGISLDDFVYSEAWEPLLRLSDYVKLDVLQYSKAEIKEVLLLFKDYGIKFIAEKVERFEDFQFYKDLGFNLFQGYFFQKPTVLSSSTLDPDYMMLIDIFNAFQSNRNIKEIEALFKMTPELIYRLLTLINSVAYEFIVRISSVKQAIALLGYDNISRWILTIILASKKSDFRSDPLLESAVIKGKMMEDICEKYIDKDLSDKAFLMGMLSLVNVALGISLEDLLDKINIDTIIYEALIEHKGKLGDLVEFMEKYGENDYVSANVILKKINPSALISDIFEIDTVALMYLENVKKTKML
ncbi:EAL and HDOD domain-containing protein [Candidatus Acidulodesulfobacterium sp. H_13]|uniref:EAL and HDOD domain-containing protein n=1 Tax=Candidatus Acidulodesulfobacterium sp. H_13 TaxID=3395470 RepID=UPI003AF8C150